MLRDVALTWTRNGELGRSRRHDGHHRQHGCRSDAYSIGTIILPIGQSAIPASFKCAQANEIPIIVMATELR